MNTILYVLSVIMVLITLLPLVKSDKWFFRVFDYPRLQKFILSVLLLSFMVYCCNYNDTVNLVFIVIMSLNLLYLTIIILPYTIFGKKQVQRIDKDIPENSISLLISNVYQHNTNYKGCRQEIKKADADIVLLLEANQKWEQNVLLDEEYPYSVKVPLDNTYGMLLYSRLELRGPQVKYLVEKDVPSIHTKVLLKSGKEIQLYAVHPTPPVPNENPRATERDKELLLIADLASNCTIPVIVAGDLNDVAWSHTTRLFLRMSEMLDPRRGRGFYNSFHAHYFFLRFPLDHAFISPHFKLKKMNRMDNFKSDHFPIYIGLQFEEIASAEQKPMEKDAGDVKEANEKKAKS
jgi:endonuclease/exonuclease/phosphatase (EEP) superfamily protein YafD